MRSAVSWLLGACLLVAATIGAPLGASEQILRFQSAVEVQPDGALEVEETITVRAEGNEIRRGIFRDIPVRYPGEYGLYRHVGLTLLEVKRDGRPEPHFTQHIGDFLRIYAGEEAVFLRPGDYTYSFRYRTTRQIRHFADFDEVYWNATGNFWSFPIVTAVATVTLPEGARILQHAAYTGRFGESGSDYETALLSDRSIRFETTRPLAPGEGLTVAVAFPKGILAEAGGATRFLWSLWDNLGLVLLGLGAAGVGSYFYATWHRVGRDPKRGVVIPLFKPPAGLSPAAASYVHYQGFPAAGGSALRAFIAGIMSLAVKRLIRIEDKDGTVALEAAGKDRSKLPGGEAVIMADLLRSRDRFEFDTANGTKLQAAQNRFRSAILKEHAGVFFRHNQGYFIIGALISAAALAAFAILSRPREEHVVILIAMFAAAAGGALLLSMGARRILGWLPGGGSIVAGVLYTLAGVAILVFLGSQIAGLGNAFPVLAAGAVIAIALMNVAFFHLLRAPTVVGRKVMDEIEGFRLYLSVAEASWMNMPKAPEMSPELFEAYLPYAVALGVEKPWSDAFEKHMARIMPGREQGSSYRPDWYSGDWSSGSIGRATSGMVSSLSSSMSASMPSSSSSGSGGGGSSGGGGGGGGGGGW